MEYNISLQDQTEPNSFEIDSASLAEKSARKTRRRSSGHVQYRSFGYQIDGKQNSAEITNNQTNDDARIVEKQVLKQINPHLLKYNFMVHVWPFITGL